MFCARCGTEVADQSKFCPSCGMDLVAATPLHPAEGERGAEVSEMDMVRQALQDEYEITEELGRGGMAIVFQAREKHLDREVAVKILPFSLAFDKEFVERFQREARTAAGLEHPYIIPIYRVGKAGRVIYFVMKFLRGSSLSEILQKRGALPPEEIRSFLKQTAGALGYAHQNGIVHRDIKPDNIMFDELGHAILTDFGIAKAASGTRLTGTGMSIGTPHYMSPEQARAQSLDGRSDIYSLGVVAYQCLTGKVPFDGEDAFSIGYKHIMEELPIPQLNMPDQRLLFEVVRQMMAKDPDERFPTAEQVVEALEGRTAAQVTVPQGQSVSDLPTAIMPSPARGSMAIPPSGPPTTPTTPIPMADPAPDVEKRVPAKEKKRSGVLAGMLLMLVLGGGGAGGYWYFFMGAEWPPDFSRLGFQLTPPRQDSTPAILTVDSGIASLDSVTADSQATDTDSVPPLPTVGWLALVDKPEQATVQVNGNTVYRDIIEVSPGSLRVVANRPGYRDFDATVTVGRGDTVPVTIDMVLIPQPQCANPEAARYNLNDHCFTTGPAQTAVCSVEVPSDNKPPPAQLWVNVAADGSVAALRFRGNRPANARFLAGIPQQIRNARFTPARKNGQAVVSWMRVTCRAR